MHEILLQMQLLTELSPKREREGEAVSVNFLMAHLLHGYHSLGPYWQPFTSKLLIPSISFGKSSNFSAFDQAYKCFFIPCSDLGFVLTSLFHHFPFSLGEHMGSHVMVASSDEKSDQNSPNKFSIDNPGYVLRENPKRSWRAAPMANAHHQQDRLMVCRQCGKEFQSLKALCGHMACHSDRERGLKEDDSSSWNTDHSQSDTESRLREMMRYKGVNIDNCSSSCSEIDQEQEELALCLMMLSRESGKWVNMGSTCAVESSSFSIVSETKSFNGDNTKLPKGQGIVQTENSDSGYFMNETEKVESDVSFSGLDKVEVLVKKEPSRKKKKKNEASLGVYTFCGGENTSKPKKKKKKKGHVCPICHKVYKSGQALGGHKRSHFLVSPEERNHHRGSSSSNKQHSKTTHRHFLDLNLPPPMEE